MKEFKIATKCYLIQNISNKEGAYLQVHPKLDGPDQRLNQSLKKKLRENGTWLIYNVEPVKVDVKWEDDTEIPRRPPAWYIPGRDYSLDEQYPLLAWSIMKVPKGRSNILCLGGGSGREALLMGIFEPQRKIISIDINEEDLKYAKEATINVCSMRIENLGFSDNSFDCIYGNNVIEHVYNDPDIVLREVRQVLRRAGLYICLIPLEANFSNPYHRVLEKVIRAKKNRLSRRDIRAMDPGHPWKTDLYDIKRRLQQTGFKQAEFVFFKPARKNAVKTCQILLKRASCFLKSGKGERKRSIQVLVLAR